MDIVNDLAKNYLSEKTLLNVEKELSYDIPFVPSPWEVVETMLDLAHIKPNMTMADLGAGDGRIIVAMAKMGVIAHGYEIDGQRVKIARKNINKERVQDRAFIHHRSFWNIPMDSYDIITVFGITSIMERLESKLLKEIKPTCKVISNVFRFPNWPPCKRKHNVFVYRIF